MTAADINSIVSAAGWPVLPRLLSAVYDPVDQSTVMQSWTEAVAALPSSLKRYSQVAPGQWQYFPLYIPEIFDCNKIDRWFESALDVQIAAIAAKSGQPANSRAFGTLSYLKGGIIGQGHDSDWYIDSPGRLHYFEEQLGADFAMLPIEVSTIFFEESP